MTQTTALAPNKPGLAEPGSNGLARLSWYTLTNVPIERPSCTNQKTANRGVEHSRAEPLSHREFSDPLHAHAQRRPALTSRRGTVAMALDATSAPAVSVPDLDVGTAARRSSWSEDGANDDYASSAAARRWRPACPSMCRCC